MKTTVLKSAAALGLLGIACCGTLTAADQTSQTRTPRQTNDLGSASLQTGGALGQLERANKLVGRNITGSDNQKLGKIDDLIVDLQSGRVLYAVVGSGGVAGIAEKKRAVAPGVFQESSDNNLHLNIDKAKFDGAPEFNKDIDKPAELGK